MSPITARHLFEVSDLVNTNRERRNFNLFRNLLRNKYLFLSQGKLRVNK